MFHIQLVWNPVLDNIFVLLLFLDLSTDSWGIHVIIWHSKTPSSYLFFHLICICFQFPSLHRETILIYLTYILFVCMILQKGHFCSLCVHFRFMKMIFLLNFILFHFSISAMFPEPSMYISTFSWKLLTLA